MPRVYSEDAQRGIRRGGPGPVGTERGESADDPGIRNQTSGVSWLVPGVSWIFF